MNNYVKKSLTRQFLFPLFVVIILAFVGAVVLAYAIQQDEKISNMERDLLLEKQQVVNNIENNLMLLFFHARGYYLFKSNRDLLAVNQERDQLIKAIDQFEDLQLEIREQLFLKEIKTFLDYFDNELFPSASSFVQNDNYPGLRTYSAAGATDGVLTLISQTTFFSAEIDGKLETLNKKIIKKHSNFKWLYSIYIFIMLLVLGYIMRRIGKSIGKPLEILTKASEQLISGKELQLPLVDRRDELGILAKAFYSMIRSIQGKEEELMAQNEELLAQQETLEEQQNRLEKSNEETENRRQLNQDIIDHVNEGITFVNETGVLIEYNAKLTEILGKQSDKRSSSFDEWVRLFKGRVVEYEQFLAFLKKAIFSQYKEVLMYRYELTEATPKIFDVYAVIIRRNDCRLGTLIVHRDITTEYEVDQMKSELVSTVSHELRTPLSSVLGFAELLLTKQLKPERQKRYIETIHKEAFRLTNLINDFLDIQRMESGKQSYERKELKVFPLLKEMKDRFQTTNKLHHLKMDVDKDVVISGDESKLIQLFTNLISNAIKFSPNGGTIIIKSERQENDLVISIDDEGLGIPKEEIGNLFKKFYRIDNSDRRKIGGTGLGLAICKQIVEAHQGELSVSSTLGEGSTFYVKLPLVPVNTIETNRFSNDSCDLPSLFIIEDDESLGMLLIDELKDLKLNVLRFSDGESAIWNIKKYLPDLVVLDIMLEKDMDGWDVIHELKNSSLTREIPIIISSALDEEVKGRSLGIEHYLTKPYPTSKLAEVVLEILQKGEQKGEILIPLKEIE